MKTTLVVCLCLIFVNFGQSQDLDTIIIGNKGMEMTKKTDTADLYFEFWENTAITVFPGETPPDIVFRPDFQNIKLLPSQGMSFINMVTRKNKSFESIGQKLTKEIKGGKCYKISMDLSSSKTFKALQSVTFFDQPNIQTNSTNVYTKPFNEKKYLAFKNPVKLRIFGFGSNNESEQLSESTIINHHGWKKYTLYFQPMINIHYIILEVYFGNDKYGYGNLQIDNLTDIFEIDCNK